MKPPTGLDYGKIRPYDELVEALQFLQSTYPSLIRLEDIGQSYEGRTIYALSITDQSTGPADEKPALYMDCNIHAGEGTTSALALYLAGCLAENYGSDPTVDVLLKQFTLYLIPRVAVDGTDFWLKTPNDLRSVPRTPEDWENTGTIDNVDLDDDGVTRLMRVKHPQGEWKISTKDPRIMVRRNPGELVGDFYKVYPEGRIRESNRPQVLNPGGVDSPWPVDLNRQFPCNWSPKQKGAGPYPLSEAESKAQATFILNHRNIGAMIVFHTAGDAILKPVPSPPAEGYCSQDLYLYDVMGNMGTQYSGYPVLDARQWSFERRGSKGGFADWAYNHVGGFCYLIEMWDMFKAADATIPPEKKGRFYEDISEDQEIKILQWLDREFGGEGFAMWKPFNHPDLGEVEIGGWDLKWTRHNPPGHYFLPELERNVPFVLELMGALPRVIVDEVQVDKLDDNTVRVQAVIKNDGYLPTYVTEKALEIGMAKPVRAWLEIEQGEIVGLHEIEIGHLDGRSTHGDMQGRTGYNIYWHSLPRFEKRVEWVVSGLSGTLKGQISAGTPRAGLYRLSL